MQPGQRRSGQQVLGSEGGGETTGPSYRRHAHGSPPQAPREVPSMLGTRKAPKGHGGGGKKVCPDSHTLLLARGSGKGSAARAPCRSATVLPPLKPQQEKKKSSSHSPTLPVAKRGEKGKAPTSRSRRRRRCVFSGTWCWLGAARALQPWRGQGTHTR